MRKKYNFQNLSLVLILLSLTIMASCKKDKKITPVPPNATPTKLGIFEVDSDIFKLLVINVTKVGTKTVNDQLIFDTGSGGMVLGADGIVPKSMYSDNGFIFTGDSVVVNGVTITNQTEFIKYGADANTTTTVYGNLAYANVTVGDASGNVVVKRFPFFLYYKGTNIDGSDAGPHDFDILGVDSEYDLTFPDGTHLQSPFAVYDPGTGLTKGFKMAALGTSNFTLDGNYVPGVITVGLTPADISGTSYFIHQLTSFPPYGYPPIVPTTINYNGTSVNAKVVYDTGTEPYSYVQDLTAPSKEQLLPTGSTVKLSTLDGFSYTYKITDKENLTYVENPSTSKSTVTVIGLEFFLHNSYLIDYTDHTIGLKNE